MSTIDITNLTDRKKTFRLPHQDVCIKAGRCLCERNMGSSALHIFAHKTVYGVNQAVMHAPDIQAALASVPPEILVKETKARPKIGEKTKRESSKLGSKKDDDKGQKPSTSGKGKGNKVK